MALAVLLTSLFSCGPGNYTRSRICDGDCYDCPGNTTDTQPCQLGGCCHIMSVILILQCSNRSGMDGVGRLVNLQLQVCWREPTPQSPTSNTDPPAVESVPRTARATALANAATAMDQPTTLRTASSVSVLCVSCFLMNVTPDVANSWTAWSDLSNCSTDCGVGVISRTRYCTGGVCGSCDGPSAITTSCSAGQSL